MNDCNKFTIGIVSDTHLCSKEQQLHMLNTAYKYFYEKEINMADQYLHGVEVIEIDEARGLLKSLNPPSSDLSAQHRRGRSIHRSLLTVLLPKPLNTSETMLTALLFPVRWIRFLTRPERWLLSSMLPIKQILNRNPISSRTM